MKETPAWIIDDLKRQQETQADEREQLRLPLYYDEPPPPKPETENSHMIVIEL